MKFERMRQSRGQTALEYAMVLVMIIVPLALALRSLLGIDQSDKAKPSNIMGAVTKDSYGDEKRLGVIGRPYP